MVNLPAFGFTAEYLGDHPAYNEFDEYLQNEFVNRHPGWQPTFGKATRFDPSLDRYDYMYLLSGNVPDAESHADAEKKVRELVDELSYGRKTLGARVERAIPKPKIKVWKWH
jgi:hypothetical protein